MKKIECMRANFSELFKFAEKFGIGWNTANDLFWRRAYPMKYESINDIYLSDIMRGYYPELENKDVRDEILQQGWNSAEDKEMHGDVRVKLAYAIMIEFMLEHNLEHVEIDSRD